METAYDRVSTTGEQVLKYARLSRNTTVTLTGSHSRWSAERVDGAHFVIVVIDPLP
jgi:hypothetical protein